MHLNLGAELTAGRQQGGGRGGNPTGPAESPGKFEGNRRRSGCGIGRGQAYTLQVEARSDMAGARAR